MSAHAGPRPLVAPALREGLARAGTLRVVTLSALMAYGLLHWAQMVSPRATGALLAMGGLALAMAFALRQRPADPVVRWGLHVGAVVGALVATLLLSGVPLSLLAPEGWGALVSGLGQGVEALPSVRLPYGGADEWTRTVLILDGGLLALLGAGLGLVAFGGGRPALAALPFGVLYAAPVVEQGPDLPYLDGAGFALLLGAYLWSDHLRGAQAPVALAVLVSATTFALIVAPRVDADRPWFDYEQFADTLERSRTSNFFWDHDYGPLDWPRDGREVLRIKARQALYWKAASLEDFDGVAWRRATSYNPALPDSEFDTAEPRWRHRLQVVVRGLRSREYVAAGTTIHVFDEPVAPHQTTPGTFVASRRPLRRGDTYAAAVYAPDPTEAQLQQAGAAYPIYTGRHLSIGLPTRRGGRRGPFRRAADSFAEVRFPAWGSDEPTFARFAFGEVEGDASELVRRSPYGRMYALAQRLKRASTSPYEYVRNVVRYVRTRAEYSETPPRRRVPLDAFLFRDREGFCQQFSGATALLLRMGGVPARVATGFSPGSYDEDRKEFVVRDLDAHSWVEAYFPTYGWVPFDPTPAEAPARSQSSGDEAEAAAEEVGDAGSVGDRGSDPAAGGTADTAGGPRLWLLPVAVIVLVGGALLMASVLRRRREGGEAGPERDLAELRRALARSGRAPAPGTTLARIEAPLSGDARDYVRALREARFRGAAHRGPLPRQRRALRRELAAGLGLGGRLRALWALPPRWVEIADALRGLLPAGGRRRPA